MTGGGAGCNKKNTKVRNEGKLAFSPDGTALASGHGKLFSEDDPGEIKLWDVETGSFRLMLRGQAGAISALAFTPDGKAIALGDAARAPWHCYLAGIAPRRQQKAAEAVEVLEPALKERGDDQPPPRRVHPERRPWSFHVLVWRDTRDRGRASTDGENQRRSTHQPRIR
jgi:hypothetical protein